MCKNNCARFLEAGPYVMRIGAVVYLDFRTDGGAVVHMVGGAVVALDRTEAATLRAALLQPGIGAGQVAEGDSEARSDHGRYSGANANLKTSRLGNTAIKGRMPDGATGV